MEKTRCILINQGIPIEEWPLVTKMACWLYNRIPSRSNPQWKCPYEMFYGKLPDLSHVRVPGCAVFIHIDKEKRVEKKLGIRALERILMGFESNGILAMNRIDRLTLKSCNFRAVEDKRWEEVVLSLSNSKDENFAIDPLSNHAYAWQFVASEGKARDLSDHVPMNFRDIFESPFKEVWLEAVKSEFESLFENSVWSEMTRSMFENGKVPKLMGTHWIFSVKYDGNIEIAKARLVAKGYLDKNVYSLKETYSPVINHAIIRWVISLSNLYNLALIAIDVKTAFLYGKIDHDTYLSIPDGLSCGQNMVALKLNKSLYRLKISSKTWFNKLMSVLQQIGFVPYIPDQCIFFM